MWNLKDENKEENALHIKRALEDLNGKIPGLLRLTVNRAYNGFDLCLYSEFETRADVLSYRDNPLHVACQQIVHAAMSERVVCNYEG
ncbi:MAG: Dabb family protein [Clostridia bacterium]|nr:Dabb family protein [Clostridia bacterium]